MLLQRGASRAPVTTCSQASLAPPQPDSFRQNTTEVQSEPGSFLPVLLAPWGPDADLPPSLQACLPPGSSTQTRRLSALFPQRQCSPQAPLGGCAVTHVYGRATSPSFSSGVRVWNTLTHTLSLLLRVGDIFYIFMDAFHYFLPSDLPLTYKRSCTVLTLLNVFGLPPHPPLRCKLLGDRDGASSPVLGPVAQDPV